MALRSCTAPLLLGLWAPIVLALSCNAAGSEDWPHWMGPQRNGTARARAVFPPDGELDLRVRWRRPLGDGYSSVSVAGGLAYTLASDDERDFLVAVAADDGREMWRVDLDEAAAERTSSTPAVGGGRVFALNGRGKLHAVAAADGKPVWSRDLQETLGAVPLSYGMSTSPLLVDGLVVVLVGGSTAHNLVAFDQASGEVSWSVFHAKRGSYASPNLLTIAGVRQIVTPADDRLYAVRPEDGSLLWARDDLGYLDRIPLLLPGERIFLAQERGAVMLRVIRDGETWHVEEIWRSRELKDSYSPAVHHEGAIYGFNASHLTCLDAATGELRWREQIGSGSLILVDGHLTVLDAHTGELRLVAARPDGFRQRAAVHALAGGGSYAPPSFADGRIFVRSKREVAAIEVAR